MKPGADTPLVLHAVGDVGPLRPDLASIFAGVPRLSDCDVLFGQMETVVTAQASPAPNARLAMRSPPETAAMLRSVGFYAMSVAGNHAMDYGAAGLLDCIANLRAAGIAPCGGGASLPEARKPAIVERNGRRIAFLAYSSILPAGYAAEANRPGCAPMWAHTHYQQIEPDQPGTGARTRSFADREHLAALVQDVKDARRDADIVAVSLHWGVHFVRAVLADYQAEVAHAAIDAGAHMILGHHPHLLKGVEIYRGRPILYSLGNFAIEQPSAFKADVHRDAAFADISRLGSGWRPGEAYMAPPETRHTVIARLIIDGAGAVTLRLRPCWIDDTSTPQALQRGDPRWSGVLDYLAAVTAEAGLTTRLEAAGDEIGVLHD